MWIENLITVRPVASTMARVIPRFGRAVLCNFWWLRLALSAHYRREQRSRRLSRSYCAYSAFLLRASWVASVDGLWNLA